MKRLQKRINHPKNRPPKLPTFSDHLLELRSRILWCVAAVIVGSAAGYFFHNQILTILIHPLNQTIFYTSPTGGFDFVLNVSLFFGFLVALPMITYQTVKFIEPALPQKFPRLFLTIFTASALLLVTGMSFAYFVSLPAALYFLNKFTTSEVQALISTTEYFSFVTRYLLGFGLAFQLPLIMLAVNAVHKISLTSLFDLERYVILGSVIVAAILTPTPDILNQTIMALPMVLLYQLTVVLIWAINRHTTIDLTREEV